jgi:hypothetical protein
MPFGMNLRQAAGTLTGMVGRKLGVQELGISEAIAGKARAQTPGPKQIQGLKTQVPGPGGAYPIADPRTAGALAMRNQGGTYNQTANPIPQPQPASSGEPSGGGDSSGGGYDPLGGLRNAYSSIRSAYEGLLPTYDADYKTFETRTNDAVKRAKDTLTTQNQEDEVRFGENLRNLLQSDKELRQRRQGVFSGLNALDSSEYKEDVEEADQFLLESKNKLTSEKERAYNERQNEYAAYEKNAVSKIAEYGNEIARAKQALKLAVANVNIEEAASIQERIDQLSAEAKGIYDNMTNFKM